MKSWEQSFALIGLVQLLSHVWLCNPVDLEPARLPCPSLSPRICSNSCPLSQQCHPTISSALAPFSSRPQSFPASRSFSKELVVCIRWPKYWSFSVSPSNEYSGLISFRIDWFNLLAIHGTLKSLLQHHNLKALLWCWMVSLGNELRSFGHFWDCT